MATRGDQTGAGQLSVPSSARSSRWLRSSPVRRQWRHQLAEITTPTLWLHGADARCRSWRLQAAWLAVGTPGSWCFHRIRGEVGPPASPRGPHVDSSVPSRSGWTEGRSLLALVTRRARPAPQTGGEA